MVNQSLPFSVPHPSNDDLFATGSDLFATGSDRSAAGHALARPGWGTPAWAGSTTSLAVDGFTLTRPFVFVGRNLQPRWGSAVDLSLPSAPDGLAGRPGATTYAQLTSRQRNAFLRWLAGDRTEPLADEALLRAFLSGVEDFLLAPRADAESDEIEHVLAELQQLAWRYRGTQGQLADRCLSLHDYFRLQRLEAAGLRAYADTGYTQLAGLPASTGLRFAIGHLREDRKKLSARWAYQWTRCLLSRADVSDLAYCEEPFRRLFIQKYVQAFGEGIALPETDQTGLQAGYEPLNPELAGKTYQLRQGAATVSYWPQATQPMSVLLAQCFDELKPYLIARRNGALADDCWSILPVSLWPEEHRLAFRGIVQQALDTPTPVTYAQLAPYLRLPASASKKAFTAMKARLGEFGLVTYPDLAGPVRPKTDVDVFVVMADAAERVEADPLAAAYEACVRLCLSDIAPGSPEWAVVGPALAHHAAAPGRLSRDLRLQRRAQLSWLESQPVKKVSKASWNKLPVELQQQALELLRNLLAGCTQALAFPVLDRLLGTGWRNPPSATLALDVGRVSRLTEETAKVQALLGSVFETTAPPIEPVSGAVVASRAVGGRRAFLAALSGTTLWSEERLGALAREHNLLPGAALEWVNEQAYDRFDSPLLEEGSEGWHLDEPLLAELLASDLAE